MEGQYNISCFWETQPLGCVRISCVFHHSKPRNINGLFLPPSSNTTLQQDVQEGILHPACSQESLKNQENILRPIHPPLIININHQEDEEEDEEEENYVSYLLAKTAADIEEERAIKEMCCKSGKYEISDSFLNSNVANVVNVFFFFPFGGYGDGNTIPTTFNNSKRQGMTSVSLEDSTRTDLRTFESGVLQNTLAFLIRKFCVLFEKKVIICYFNPLAMNLTELVKKHHFKGVKKKKWISEETRNSPNTVTAMHTSTPQIKANYQRNDQSKDDENASYIPSVRATGRRTYLNSSEPGRSACVFYRNVTVIQEPKLSGSMDNNTSGPYNAPAWRKRNPRAKTFSKLKTTIQVTFIEIFAIHSSY
uniref:Chromosome 12 open reading frame 50 n=1 Tax=Apteryx owenii TaxID=8824 RepID=A0A8B9QBK3_APTOW